MIPDMQVKHISQQFSMSMKHLLCISRSRFWGKRTGKNILLSWSLYKKSSVYGFLVDFCLLSSETLDIEAQRIEMHIKFVYWLVLIFN